MKAYVYFDEFGEWTFFKEPDRGFDQLCSDGVCSRLEIETDGTSIRLETDSGVKEVIHGHD